MFSRTKIISFRNIVTLLVPKSYLSEILWRFRNIMTLFKGPLSYQKIIGSPSLSILFLPNSNSFPLNSNIADTQWSKNPFLYTAKDRRKKRYVFYVSGKSPNLPIGIPEAWCFSYQNHIFPKYCDASEIFWRSLRVLCHIKKIIGSLSLSILFSPNSNSFSLNSNIADTQRSKNPLNKYDRYHVGKSVFSFSTIKQGCVHWVPRGFSGCDLGVG